MNPDHNPLAIHTPSILGKADSFLGLAFHKPHLYANEQAREVPICVLMCRTEPIHTVTKPAVVK